MKLLRQAKHRLGEWARQQLRRAGYTLERLPETAPVGLPAMLRKLLATVPPDEAILYDGCNRIVLELLRATGVRWTPTPTAGQTISLAIVDLAPGHTFSWQSLAAGLSDRGRILVRIPGVATGGLAALDAVWEQLGLRLLDVAELPRLTRPVEAIERLTLLLAPLTAPAPAGAAAQRIDELRTWLGGPLPSSAPPRRIAGPAAGPGWNAVLNPGALARPDGTLLLCRVEDATWQEMKRDETVFMRRCPPRLLELDHRGEVRSAGAATWTDAPPADTHRLEDFRLFRHADRIVSNHAVLRLPVPARAGRPVALEQIETRVGFSLLDPDRAELRFLGEPKLPRTLGQTEKNWACFGTGEDLFLLYSPSPYRLYRCTNWERLEFSPKLEAGWNLPGSSPDLPPLRNSLNPTVYDEDHWLHVVHRVYPGKRYAYWPLLISRRTLRPVQASGQPLACGGWSGGDGLLYLSAAVAGPESVDLYFGLEDCATGHTRLSRRDLDARWRPVTTS